MINTRFADEHGHSVEITENGNLSVQLPGPISQIPATADTQAHSFEVFTIGNKGQANILTYRPVFQNENVADSGSVVLTLNGSGTSYGMQIFRASALNVNTLAVTTRAIPVGTLEDAFATGWTSSAPSKITVTNGAADYYNNTTLDTSSNSLKLTLGNNVPGVTISKTVSENWSTVSTFSLYFRATTALAMFIRLSDGTNSSTWNFNNVSVNTFEQKVFDFSTPSSTSGTLNIALITNIAFGVYTTGNLTGQFAWLDALESQAAPGTLYLQLWDFGTNIKPSNFSLGTQLVFDDGNTQLQINNPIVKTTQRVSLKYGILDINKQLKFGNYYGLVFYNGGSGTVEVYGNSSTKIYQNGNVFSSSNVGGVLTEIPNSSLYFGLFSFKECWIRRLTNSTNSTPGQSRVITIIYSQLNKKRKATLQNNMRFHNNQYIELNFTDIPKPMDADDQIVMNYVDDANSSVSELQIGIDAIYEDFTLWG